MEKEAKVDRPEGPYWLSLETVQGYRYLLAEGYTEEQIRTLALLEIAYALNSGAAH
jgi:hypothetical protein